MSRKSHRRRRASIPVKPPLDQVAPAVAAPKQRNPLVWNPLLQKGGVHKSARKAERRRQKVALQRLRDEQSRPEQISDRDGFAHRVDAVDSVSLTPQQLARARCRSALRRARLFRSRAIPSPHSPHSLRCGDAGIRVVI